MYVGTQVFTRLWKLEDNHPVSFLGCHLPFRFSFFETGSLTGLGPTRKARWSGLADEPHNPPISVSLTPGLWPHLLFLHEF